MKKVIYLLRIGELNQSILSNLKKNLEDEFKEFNIKVEIFQDVMKLKNSEYDAERKQYKAPKILKRLVEKVKIEDFFRILGITDKDIYSKTYNFIFGIAGRGSNAALISLARLRESFYDDISVIYRRKESTRDFEVRILKEAIHELGHTFGLKHCYNVCVMRFSNSLADTDKKPVKFCASCLQSLKSNI
ncbi:MAG: archaemetzincin family Zn-dependent metalloprotease [Candidatus Thorarchaeota archaeon]